MSLLQRFKSDLIYGALSLDRVTFLIYSPSLSLWQKEQVDRDFAEKKVSEMSKFTERILKENLDPDFGQGRSSELFAKHYRTSAGVDIQFGSYMPVRKKKLLNELASAYGVSDDGNDGSYFEYSASKYCFRVEFNPNECDLSSVKNLLKYFSEFGLLASDIRLARLDVAIDYKAAIDPALCICDRMRKSFLAIGSSGIETVYFGSRSSQNYIRLYDKAKEMLERDNIVLDFPLWRFELENKAPCFLSDTPDFSKVLQRFFFFSGGLNVDDWKLQLLLQHAREYGIKSSLSLLPSATAKRYKKMLQELDVNHYLETPYECYCREFHFAFNRLRVQILDALGLKLEGVA